MEERWGRGGRGRGRKVEEMGREERRDRGRKGKEIGEIKLVSYS